jgi:hypothetical protein
MLYMLYIKDMRCPSIQRNMPSPKKDAGSSTPSPQKNARSRTPSGPRTVKSANPAEETTEVVPEPPVTVSVTSTGSKAADEEEIIDEPPTKEKPPPKVSGTTVTVEKEEVVQDLAIFLEILDTKFFVGVVYALVVVFLFNKWKTDMMCAFGISALMTSFVSYSMDRNMYRKETVALLAVLGGVGGFVTPDKPRNSIEAIQKLAVSLPAQFNKYRLYEKLAHKSFLVHFKDPKNPLSKEFEKVHGKPFEPHQDEDWDKYNQFSGCEIRSK